MSIESIPNVKFITPAHRYYEYVLDFVLASASFGAYFKVYHGEPITSFVPFKQGEDLFYPSMQFMGISSGRHLNFMPHELFTDVILIIRE